MRRIACLYSAETQVDAMSMRFALESGYFMKELAPFTAAVIKIASIALYILRPCEKELRFQNFISMQSFVPPAHVTLF